MHVCLLVPGGDFDPGATADAVRAAHPTAVLSAVWAGDPHRRPCPVPGVEWIDLDLDEPVGVGWGRLLVALPPECHEWVRVARAIERQFRTDASNGRGVVVLRVGSVGVVGALDGLLPGTGAALVSMAPEALDSDGRWPGERDVAVAGEYSLAAAGFAPDAAPLLDRIAATLARGATDDAAGVLFASAVRRSGVPIDAATGVIVAGTYPSPVRTAPGAVVIDLVDRGQPWHLDAGAGVPRVMLSDDPVLASSIESTQVQWRGGRDPVVLPGGVRVDASIRALVHGAIRQWWEGSGDLPPDPFVGAGLLDWLETPDPATGTDIGRYWFEEWRRRVDLHVAFPGAIEEHREGFVRWAERSWETDRRSPVIRADAQRLRPAWRDAGHQPGVNLIGYIASDLGLGDFTRRVHDALRSADVPVAALHYHRTLSPPAADVPELTDELRFDVNLLTVHADQMRQFAGDYGPEVFEGRHTIGYWFWELAHVPDRIAAAIELVDEVWAATEFVADGFRAVTDKPVRVVPIPVPEPTPSARSRSELGLPADRFVFLVTFDHLSITERKNPLAAVEAFRRAFPDPAEGGPVLVVKTLNGPQRWVEHEQIRLAAAGRDDIVVVDGHFSRPDQMALIAASDCLVSLHRSEGLGLHLMEAMWLGVPVLATRYSGNMDFMDDANAALVDFDLVPVVDREHYYPPEALWAEPDLDHATAWMRRCVTEPELMATLAAAARRTMAEQPSRADTGRAIDRLCRTAPGGR